MYFCPARFASRAQSRAALGFGLNCLASCSYSATGMPSSSITHSCRPYHAVKSPVDEHAKARFVPPFHAPFAVGSVARREHRRRRGSPPRPPRRPVADNRVSSSGTSKALAYHADRGSGIRDQGSGRRRARLDEPARAVRQPPSSGPRVRVHPDGIPAAPTPDPRPLSVVHYPDMLLRITVALSLAASAALAQTAISPEREASMKADLAGQIDGMKKQAQVMVDTVFSYGELGFQEFETSKYLTGILEKEGFKIERGVAGIPTAFLATWGSGQAGDLARLRYRRHSASLAKAGRGMARSDYRGRTRSWRRPQFRHAAEHHGGDCGQEGDGAGTPARHLGALARRGRRTARHQGLLRPRRPV